MGKCGRPPKRCIGQARCGPRKVPFTVFGRPKLSPLDDHAFMNIQEHLSAFDRWLTSRIEEAQSGRKDLAFRDLAIDLPSAGAPWEYSLLEPGGRSPPGEGWSVYRLHGIWPEPAADASSAPRAPGAERRPLLALVAGALLGREAARH